MQIARKDFVSQLLEKSLFRSRSCTVGEDAHCPSLRPGRLVLRWNGAL